MLYLDSIAPKNPFNSFPGPPLLAGWIPHARSTFLQKRGVLSTPSYGKNICRKLKKGVWGVYYRLVSFDLKKMVNILSPVPRPLAHIPAAFPRKFSLRGLKSIKKPVEKG
jgi:hypothetical protein